MKKLVLLSIAMFTSIAQAWTIKVNNDTGYDIAVAQYYFSAGTQGMVAVGALAFGIPGAVIGGIGEEEIKKFKNKKFSGFRIEEPGTDKDFGYLAAKASKPLQWKIGSGCIRAVKAWIVEKKSIKARDVLDIKKFKDNSTLKSIVEKLKNPEKRWEPAPWEQALKENKTIDYVEYNPILGQENSWTAKVVHADENQCTNHTFNVRVKKYDDGTKRLKIDIK